jgi:hypothetical protein
MVMVRRFVTVHHGDTEDTENSHGEQQRKWLSSSVELCVSVSLW